jgi:hypothetical protein
MSSVSLQLSIAYCLRLCDWGEASGARQNAPSRDAKSGTHGGRLRWPESAAPNYGKVQALAHRLRRVVTLIKDTLKQQQRH